MDLVRAGRCKRFEKDGVKYLQGLLTDVTSAGRQRPKHTRLVTAIEQSSEAVVITDPQGTIEYVNPAFRESPVTPGGGHRTEPQDTEIRGKHAQSFTSSLGDDSQW